MLAHALAGCAAGQITRNCVGGAIGAGLQEVAGDTINKITSDPERQVQLAGLIAATATLLVGGDADAVSAANAIAQDARTYNRNLHPAEKSLNKLLAQELSEKTGRTQLQEREVIDQITCVLVQCSAGINALDPTSPAYAERVGQLWKTYPEEMALVSQVALALIGGDGQGAYTYSQRDAVLDRDIGIQPVYPEDALFGLIGLASGAKAGIRFALNAAAPAIEIGSLRFTQTTASPMFSDAGRFAGKSIGQVADDIRTGALSVSEVPVEIIRNGEFLLVVNTRSSLALRRAGIPPQQWSIVDSTGNVEVVGRMSERLSKNQLNEFGADVIRITGGGNGVSAIK